jgi:hypothetical protein
MGVTSFIDHPHPALAEFGLDALMRKRLAG